MYLVSGDTDPLILNLGIRWKGVVSFTPQELYYWSKTTSTVCVG